MEKQCPGCKQIFKSSPGRKKCCSRECYLNLRSPGRALVEDGHKCCNNCLVVKPLDAFAKRAASRDGLQHRCRDCIAKWQDDNRERRRKTWSAHAHRIRLAKYGITQEFLEQEVERIGKRCEICNRDLMQGKGGSGLAIDHDHATNKYRGILCSTCNKAIGCFEDNPDTVMKAALYLEQRAETH